MFLREEIKTEITCDHVKPWGKDGHMETKRRHEKKPNSPILSSFLEL